MSESDRLQHVARHLERLHRRIELTRGQCETRLRRVCAMQVIVAAARDQAHAYECPIEHAGAWAGWRAAHLGRLASEDQALETQRQRLVRALAVQTKRLAQSTGRRRALERLVTAAQAVEQRRAEGLQQAELDQRAGLRATGRDGLT